jgi:hypothetical protein
MKQIEQIAKFIGDVNQKCNSSETRTSENDDQLCKEHQELRKLARMAAAKALVIGGRPKDIAWLLSVTNKMIGDDEKRMNKSLVGDAPKKKQLQDPSKIALPPLINETLRDK